MREALGDQLRVFNDVAAMGDDAGDEDFAATPPEFYR